MYKNTFFIIFLICNSISVSQLIRTDDFKFKSDSWFWRADGNQNIPTVNNGMLHLELVNALDTGYCNTEIYDSAEPYGVGTQVKFRLKCSSLHVGSRGWGFWDGSLSELQNDYDVAWVMQQGSDISNPFYDWFLFGVDGNLLINRRTFDLQNVVDETNWHTYKIIWRADSTFLFVDNNILFVATDNLPDENMRIDFWIDNRVININNPLEFWNNNTSGSEMFVDFVEVSGFNGPAITRAVGENILLWDSPNTYPNGDTDALWKSYNFYINSTCETLIFITGDAEKYSNDDDDLKFVLDNTDYGWNSSFSLDGNSQNGSGGSISLPIILTESNHKLSLYSDITPFLRDVIILSNVGGKVIINNKYDEAESANDGLWKSINFELADKSQVTFLISGSGYSNDKIKVMIDGTDYLWDSENSINGDELQGMPKTIVINDVLEPGNHSIKIYEQGAPKLFNVAAYCTKIQLLDLKVILEGGYQNNQMVGNISDSELFPLKQPFTSSPWNYLGNEKINIMPNNIVDWILIELIDNRNNPTKNYKRAALLNESGYIVDLDGTQLKLYGIASGTYFINLYHRNHLAISSANNITFE